jgi:hypothetical protein
MTPMLTSSKKHQMTFTKLDHGLAIDGGFMCLSAEAKGSFLVVLLIAGHHRTGGTLDTRVARINGATETGLAELAEAGFGTITDNQFTMSETVWALTEPTGSDLKSEAERLGGHRSGEVRRRKALERTGW